jgi:hypothetical protein
MIVVWLGGMVKEGNVEWFKSHVGSPNGRFDIRRKLNDSHVLVEDYEAISGKRKANNGFKLGTCSNLGLDAQIWELWPMICKEHSHLQRILIPMLKRLLSYKKI